MATRHVSIPVFGFACGGGGALTVERVLSRVPGAVSVYVNPATGLAEVDFDAERVSVDELRKAIRRCGFRPGAPHIEGPSRNTSDAPRQGQQRPVHEA